MWLFFADDSKQNSPSRSGMGPLVAVGGIGINADAVRDVERGIEQLCADRGFPPGAEFKWSPPRDSWMRGNLNGPDREAFYLDVLQVLAEHEAGGVVTIADTTARPATAATTPEMDVTNLFLERVERRLGDADTTGIVIVDRPGGGRPEEKQFLLDCLSTLQAGTDWVNMERIAIGVLTADSHLVRLLQAADLITACTLARVSGEKQYSPPVFEAIKGLFFRSLGRAGGIGLKLHPDGKYANLYHWLVGDDALGVMGLGRALPSPNWPYATDPDA